MDIFIAILVIFLPLLALYLCKVSKFFASITPVTLCYGIGMIMSNFVGLEMSGTIGKMLPGIIVVFALSLMLMSSDMKKALVYAPKVAITTVVYFGFVVLSAVLMAKFFPVENGKLFSALFTGTFVGSMPNLAAIGTALNAPNEVYVLAQLSDLLICGVYFLLLVSVVIRIAGLFLNKESDLTETEESQQESSNKFEWKGPLMGLTVSGAIIGISLAFSKLFSPQKEQLIIILSVSVLAVVMSFVNKVRTLPQIYNLGEYLFLSFCVAVGSLAKFSKILGHDGSIFLFAGGILLVSLVFHFIFCKIFKIDRDTAIIASTAGIFSPAMIGPIVTILGNRNILVPGIGAGLIGLALGTLSGLLVYSIL